MTRCSLFQFRFLLSALLGRIRTACMETTAGRNMQRTRKVSLDAAVFQAECPLRICDRNGGQQCPGVWVAWIIIHFIAVSALHDLTKVHHTDPVGDMAHHGQIMCHKQISQSQFLLQIFQHVDNLCLDRYVQCGDRFVAEQEFRMDG